RKDVAACFEDSPHACRRNRAVANLVSDFLIVRPRGWQIAIQGDGDLPRLAAHRIKQIDAAELLVSENVGASGKRLEVEATTFDELLYGFSLRIVREQRDCTVAVRKKVNGVLEPDGLRVVRVIALDFFNREVAEVHDVNRRGLTAAIALPCDLPLDVRH